MEFICFMCSNKFEQEKNPLGSDKIAFCSYKCKKKFYMDLYGRLPPKEEFVNTYHKERNKKCKNIK
jgi:ribosomal protein L24E